ncbi:MAG: pyridoxamine 5'-phosphate oxidase family protein [Saprospiraceae bacterium]|nr:pyridoxamine 5'-phosphate oxidase family protein [Saprospiraceae bacterium]
MAKPQVKKLDPSKIPDLAREIVREIKFPMLATSDGDQPRVRPISPLRTEGFEIYVGNLKSYHKTKEIAANDRVELCYLDTDHNQVRITARAEVVVDKELLSRIWTKNPLLKHYLGTIENPDLIVYRCVPNRVRFMQEWALEYHDIPL